MKHLLICLLALTMFIPVAAQEKNVFTEYNNSIVVPFNETTNAVLTFNTSLMQGAPPAELIKNRDAVLQSLNSLENVLSRVKPMDNDFGIYDATKIGAETYKKFFQGNYTDEKLSITPSNARENITKIIETKRAREKIDLWNNDFQKCQNRFFKNHEIESIIDTKLIDRIKEHNAAIDYYFEVSLNQLQVQSFVDDFVAAFNSDDQEKIKISQSNLKAQIIISDKFMADSPPYKGDNSLLKSSGKLIGVYRGYSEGLIKDVIQLNSFPDEIPNEKVDDYNALLDKVDKGLEYYNTLQLHLDESQIEINKFFQTHLY